MSLHEPGGRFPDTRASAVLGIRSTDAATRSRSFETLVQAYWKPVYKHVRGKWSRGVEDAKDLTQGFFLSVLEKGTLAAFDPQKARFRTYLRLCLDGYVSNEDKAARRVKRGGEVVFLPLELEDADGEEIPMEPTAPGDAERRFDAEWVRALFELSVGRLREECAGKDKETPFLVFERFDLAEDLRPSYRELADELSIPVTQVTNHLSYARREFRRILLETLREITGGDDEFRTEARLLLGRDPGTPC